MISYITGTLVKVSEKHIVVETGGIGYKITAPSSLYASLPRIGEKVKIYTYLVVREDLMELYGFIDSEQVELYELLLSVSGVGPKVALATVGTLTVQEVILAIANEDAKVLTRVPGLGKKSAHRLAFELKDKIKSVSQFGVTPEGLADSISLESLDEKQVALEALQSLGFSREEAGTAIEVCLKDIPEQPTNEVLIKEALKRLSG